MEAMRIILNGRDIAAIKAWDNYETMTNIEYCKIICGSKFQRQLDNLKLWKEKKYEIFTE